MRTKNKTNNGGNIISSVCHIYMSHIYIYTFVCVRESVCGRTQHEWMSIKGIHGDIKQWQQTPNKMTNTIRTVLNQYFLRYNKFRRINAIQAREPQPMMIDWYTTHTYLLVRYCNSLLTRERREREMLLFDCCFSLIAFWNEIRTLFFNFLWNEKSLSTKCSKYNGWTIQKTKTQKIYEYIGVCVWEVGRGFRWKFLVRDV